MPTTTTASTKVKPASRFLGEKFEITIENFFAEEDHRKNAYDDKGSERYGRF